MKTNQSIQVLSILSWIIFIGLCIQAGTIAFSFVMSIIKDNPQLSGMEMDTIILNEKDLTWFVFSGYFTLKFSLAALKAWLFYLVIQALTQLNVEEPFSKAIGDLILKMARTCLDIGILAVITHSYVKFTFYQQLSVGFTNQDSNFFFLAGVLYVIAIIFRKGIELQAEQELTV